MSADLWERHTFSLRDIHYVLSRLSTQMLWQAMIGEGANISQSATKVMSGNNKDDNEMVSLHAGSGSTMFEYGAKTTALNQLTALYNRRHAAWERRPSVTQTQWHVDHPFCVPHDTHLPIHQITGESFERMAVVCREVMPVKWTSLQLLPDVTTTTTAAAGHEIGCLPDVELLELLLSGHYSSSLQTVDSYSDHFQWRGILVVPRDVDDSRQLMLVQRVLPLIVATSTSSHSSSDDDDKGRAPVAPFHHRRLVAQLSSYNNTTFPLMSQPKLVAVRISATQTVLCVGTDEMFYFANRPCPPALQAPDSKSNKRAKRVSS